MQEQACAQNEQQKNRNKKDQKRLRDREQHADAAEQFEAAKQPADAATQAHVRELRTHALDTDKFAPAACQHVEADQGL